MRTIYLVVVLAASLAWLMPARAADRTEITFPGDYAYPEALPRRRMARSMPAVFMRVAFSGCRPGRRPRSSGFGRVRTIR